MLIDFEWNDEDSDISFKEQIVFVIKEILEDISNSLVLDLNLVKYKYFCYGEISNEFYKTKLSELSTEQLYKLKSALPVNHIYMDYSISLLLELNKSILTRQRIDHLKEKFITSLQLTRNRFDNNFEFVFFSYFPLESINILFNNKQFRCDSLLQFIITLSILCLEKICILCKILDERNKPGVII